MFDVPKFVSRTKLAVTIVGVEKEDIVGIAVSDDSGYMSGGIFMVKQPDETDMQYSDRFERFVSKHAAKLGSKKAQHIKNAYDSHKREEIEKLFRGL